MHRQAVNSIVKHHRRLSIALGVALVPMAAFAAMGLTTQPDGLVTCDIRTSQSGDQIMLNAETSAERNVNGSYSFRVSGTGSSNGTTINQSGAFVATPSQPATLGSVMLNAKGASYRATLDITVDQQKTSCSKRIGGSI